MAGIYIHIPFCKQACHYCDFHFSTNLKHKINMIDCICREMEMRKDTVLEPVETIYFGGGTPSVLTNAEIQRILDTVYANYNVADNPEITLEANPDDLTLERIQQLAASKINRLSVGVQSFFDQHLQLMNRAHNATEAWNSLQEATKYFDNISIDLIYGIPGLTIDLWEQNINRALALGINHISSYALTVEPKTALDKLIAKGQIPAPDDAEAHEHFLFLMETLKSQGFEHYELSNFAKPGYYSKNNSAYWLGKKYIGIGPSAHSFDGFNRSWNISNNILYINAIAAGKRPFEEETLTINDRYNEYIMTGLRTIWGVQLQKIKTEYGSAYQDYLLQTAAPYLASQDLIIENDTLKTTTKGKFFSDGIASSLFKI